jgi:hypothetical protein
VKNLALGVANKMEIAGIAGIRTVVKAVSSEVCMAENPRVEQSRPICVSHELILLTIHDTSTFLVSLRLGQGSRLSSPLCNASSITSMRFTVTG